MKIILTSFALLLFAGITLGCKNQPKGQAKIHKVSVKQEGAATETPLISDTVNTRHIRETASDSLCLGEVEMDYPNDGPQPLVDSIRVFLSKELYGACGFGADNSLNPAPMYSGDMQNGSAMAKFYARSFFRNLQILLEDIPLNVQLEQSLGFRKVYESGKIVTFLTSGYIYQGGAHGMAGKYGTMFTKADGKKITTEIIDSTKIKALQPLLEKGVKSYFEGAGTPVEGDVCELLQLESELIPLPANQPFFTSKGVELVYSEYEIGPYAIGMPTFTIPYNDIYPFLTPQAKRLVIEEHGN